MVSIEIKASELRTRKHLFCLAFCFVLFLAGPVSSNGLLKIQDNMSREGEFVAFSDFPARRHLSMTPDAYTYVICMNDRQTANKK